MVETDDLAEEIRTRIDSHFEWLLVRGDGRTFPLRRTEIELRADRGRILFGVFDDRGFDVSRLLSAAADEGDLLFEIAGRFGAGAETVRLIPRTSARELSSNVEFARLERANLIGKALIDEFPAFRLIRIALNSDNGRIAQIFLHDDRRRDVALMTDVTSTMTHEAVLTSAVLWGDKLRLRKRPINEVWIAAEKKPARNLRRLLSMLHSNAAARFRIFEISNADDHPHVHEVGNRPLSSLWREKSARLSLPSVVRPSVTTERIVALSPDRTDVIFSKQGETIRFNGLPFARVRTLAGRESAWFGIDRRRELLTDDSWSDLRELINDLELYRCVESPNTRHDQFRAAPEAWLESILRRNIKLLDQNLILSPIYNQFRASADKIDLLAIRRDGRLVIIELKTSPDRETVFQAADYWRKIELQRRRGDLARARAFGDRTILDKPALVYAVAPALSFHPDFDLFAGMLRPEVEVWRFELREDWRREIKVLRRRGPKEKS